MNAIPDKVAAKQSIDTLLACPRCDRAPLDPSDRGYRCAGCKTVFSSLSNIPWLFAEPDAARAEWRQRIHLAVQQLARETALLGKALRKRNLLDATRRRLELLETATREHRRNLLELLAPLDVGSGEMSYESHLALRTRLPSDQGLNTYYGNVHRDWVWGDEENRASIDEIAAALPAGADGTSGDCLVLGAGAGRLSYDLHQRRQFERTVAVDFNPLLLLIAERMFAGDRLSLWELPIAPSSLENVAVLQTLEAPARARPGLMPVLADVLRPPFRAGAFNTVVTPWLIDIVGEDLRRFAGRINTLLADGGRWITFGSLAFDDADRALRYSPEEVGDIAAQAGFTVDTVRNTRIPYLCSPYSRHGRRELVFTLAARRTSSVKAPSRHRALPDWLVVGREPVPLSQSFQTQAMSTRIHAFIMSLIDGKSSIDDMAAVLEQQRLMPATEARAAVRNFLIRMYEDSRRNASL